jgi:hypothetical protein
VRIRKAPALVVNLSVGVVGVALFLVVSELLLQVLVPVLYRPRFTRVDAELGWVHTPSASAFHEVEGHRYRVSYNAHGYRGPDRPWEKPPGVRRVVVLGDSYVDGSEVGDAEVFTAILARTLSGIDVVNLGVYGYSTAQELLTLDRVGRRYAPDLVVLVTISNDFRENALNFSLFGPAPRYRLEGDSLVLETTDSPAARAVFQRTNLRLPGMAWLHRRSLAYHFLNRYGYQRWAASRLVELRDSQIAALSEPDALALYLRLTSRMKAICDSLGADFWVVLGYLRGEVEAPDRPPLFVAARDSLEARGIRVLDLYDDLRASPGGAGTLYYARDIHWNRTGHARVAEVLLPHLRAWAVRAPTGTPAAR